MTSVGELSTAIASAANGDSLIMAAGTYDISGADVTCTKSLTFDGGVAGVGDALGGVIIDGGGLHQFILNGQAGGTTQYWYDVTVRNSGGAGAAATQGCFLIGAAGQAGNLTVTFKNCQIYSGAQTKCSIYQDALNGYDTTVYVRDALMYGTSHPASNDGHSLRQTLPGYGNNYAQWDNVVAKWCNGQCLYGQDGATIVANGCTLTNTDSDSDLDSVTSPPIECAASVAPVNEVQTLTFVPGNATGGSMTLTVPSLAGTPVTTAAITWDTIDATWLSNINNAIDTALGIATADSSIVASGALPDAALTFTFSGAGWNAMRGPTGLKNWPLISADTASLTGATGAETVVHTTIGGGRTNAVILDSCTITNSTATVEAARPGCVNVAAGNQVQAQRCTFATTVAKDSILVAATGQAQFNDCAWTLSAAGNAIGGAGTYLISDSTLTLSGDSTTCVGVNGGAGTQTLRRCTFAVAETGYPIRITTAGSCYVDDSTFTFTGTSDGTDAGANDQEFFLANSTTGRFRLSGCRFDTTALTYGAAGQAICGVATAAGNLDLIQCVFLGPTTCSTLSQAVQYEHASATGIVDRCIFASYQTAGTSQWRGVWLGGTGITVKGCQFSGFTYDNAVASMQLRLAASTGYTTSASTGNNYFGDEPAVQTTPHFRIHDGAVDLAVGSLRAGDVYMSDSKFGYRDRAAYDFAVGPTSPVYWDQNNEIKRVWWH